MITILQRLCFASTVPSQRNGIRSPRANSLSSLGKILARNKGRVDKMRNVLISLILFEMYIIFRFVPSVSGFFLFRLSFYLGRQTRRINLLKPIRRVRSRPLYAPSRNKTSLYSTEWEPVSLWICLEMLAAAGFQNGVLLMCIPDMTLLKVWRPCTTFTKPHFKVNLWACVLVVNMIWYDIRVASTKLQCTVYL